MRSFFVAVFIVACLLLAACGRDKGASVLPESSSSIEVSSSSFFKTSSNSTVVDSLGICEACDSFNAAAPLITNSGGRGSVTTYGSISAKETSQGGACNYGETRIQYYAAIHVNISQGDNLGPWQGGLACGGCVAVKVKTPDGWKSTVVRITDKCPDENCGVDLGGAPTFDLMGERVGRYEGEWEFVPCAGIESVFGDSTAIYVKEGASPFWSIIQIRNPPDALKAIEMKRLSDSVLFIIKMASEAENYWKIPTTILEDSSLYELSVSYRFGQKETWVLKGSALTSEKATLYLQKQTGIL